MLDTKSTMHILSENLYNICLISISDTVSDGATRTLDLAPVVQRLDNAIHRINHYPVDSVVCFVSMGRRL